MAAVGSRPRPGALRNPWAPAEEGVEGGAPGRAIELLPRELPPDEAVRAGKERLRNPGRPKEAGEAAVGIADVRVRDAVLGEKPPRGWFEILGVNPHDHKSPGPKLLPHGFQDRSLLCARDAPGRPKVQHDWVTTKIREGDSPPIERGKADAGHRRRLPPSKRCAHGNRLLVSQRGPRQDGQQHHNREQDGSPRPP